MNEWTNLAYEMYPISPFMPAAVIFALLLLLISEKFERNKFIFYLLIVPIFVMVFQLIGILL